MHSIQCAQSLGPRMELDGGVRTGVHLAASRPSDHSHLNGVAHGIGYTQQQSCAVLSTVRYQARKPQAFRETRRSSWEDVWEGKKKGHAWRENGPQSRKKVFVFIFRGDDNVSMDGRLLDMGHVG